MRPTREDLQYYNHADDATIFDNPDYDNAIIGISYDGAIVYGYEKMIKLLQERDGMTEHEAIEWIEYNTIRALPYMGEHHPLIIHQHWFSD